MNRRKLRLTVKKIYKPLILVSLTLYFSYHIFQGRHGFLAWGHMSKDLVERQNYLKELKIKQSDLQHKVDLMGSNLCLDLLEELAKKKLGVAHRDEIIMVRQSGKNRKKIPSS